MQQMHMLKSQSDLNTQGGIIYNVGSEEQNFIISDVAKQVAEGIKKTSGKDIPINIEDDSVDARDYRVSFKKFKRNLTLRLAIQSPNRQPKYGRSWIQKRLKTRNKKFITTITSIQAKS